MDSNTLNLWQQRLGTVPASAFENAALQTLILADNDLEALPDAIGALTNLRTLDLGHNRRSRRSKRAAAASCSSEEKHETT